jgi:peptidoglycan/LPS O-acetylase OafA/YrhL
MSTAGSGRPDHAEYLARRTFAHLDGLRCASILAVVWYHVPRQQPLPGALERGFLGVDLFFVLSGFLITALLLRERDRHGRIDLGAFYLRRTLRIFPVYYLVLLGYTAWIAWAEHARLLNLRAPFLDSLPYYATYTSNLVATELSYRHTWSLATEEQFYLFWPPVLAWCGLRSGKWFLCGALLAAGLLSFGCWDAWIVPHWTPNPAFLGTGFTPILLGVGVALILHDRRGFGWAARSLGSAWLGLLLPLLVLAAGSLPEGPTLNLASGPVHFRGLPRLLTHLAMALLVAHCVVQERTWLRPLLTLAPVQYLGRISYGMYLLHAPLFLAWYAGGHRWVGAATPGLTTGGAVGLFAVATAATVLAAALSFHGFEQPFLRWKQRFART